MEVRESRRVTSWKTVNSMRTLGEGIRILIESEIGGSSHFNLKLEKNTYRETLSWHSKYRHNLEKMVPNGEWILHIQMKRCTVEIVFSIFNIKTTNLIEIIIFIKK